MMSRKCAELGLADSEIMTGSGVEGPEPPGAQKAARA
jgi:hypothetical protein